MRIHVCDRCGDVTVEPEVCRCRTPFDPVAVHRRHRQSVRRAQATDELERTERRGDTAA